MKFPDGLSTENIIVIITAVLSVIALLNDKIKEFLLNKLSFLRSKTEVIKDTSDATDAIIDTMMKRISVLGHEFVALSESNSNTQKENYELKSIISKLEYENKTLLDLVNQNCKNNCLE